jgi:hypothetical protein
MRAATPLHEILERDWDRQLFAAGRKPGLATQLGWHSHWTFNSKGSAHGFPDRTLARERIIFVELKRERTEPTEDQRAWLDRLSTAGGECYLWRPSDLEEIARILSGRWEHVYDGEEAWPIGLSGREPGWWQPQSLWIPGVGRANTTEQQSLLAKGAA